MTTSSATHSRPSEGHAGPSGAGAVASPLFAVCAALGIFVLSGIVVVFAAEAAQPHRLWSNLLAGGQTIALGSLVGNTLLCALLAIVLAVPMGLFAALYLSEFGSPRVRGLLDPLFRFLAGVPPIIYGFFVLSTFLPALVGQVPGLDKPGVGAAGVALAVMILPLVLARGYAAFCAVPQKLRDAAYALGAGKLATAAFVVVPAARAPLFGIVLQALLRAVGETTLVLVVLGQTTGIDTLSTFVVRRGAASIRPGTIEFSTLFVVGGVLLLLAFALESARGAASKPVRGDAP